MTLTICARQATRTRSETAQQGVDEAAHQQRVLEVVDLLEQARRELPAWPLVNSPPRARYQTFHSSNDSHRRLGDLQALHVVADRGDLVDLRSMSRFMAR
jgi:hypothetical protein